MLPDLYVEVVRLCASLGMVGLGHIAFDGTKLKANASVRQTRDRDGLEKEIERIKEQMRQMIQASAKVDEIEDQIYPDGDGSEIAEELRKKECRLKKLQEASGGTGEGEVGEGECNRSLVSADEGQPEGDPADNRPSFNSMVSKRSHQNNGERRNQTGMGKNCLISNFRFQIEK